MASCRADLQPSGQTMDPHCSRAERMVDAGMCMYACQLDKTSVSGRRPLPEFWTAAAMWSTASEPR
jgi:hypothetical protein